MQNINIDLDEFTLKRLGVKDIEDEDKKNALLQIYTSNDWYFSLQNDTPSLENIKNDITLKPEGLNLDSKYYFLIYDKEKSIAVIDFLKGYPTNDTVFIGLLMVDENIQGEGYGSKIVNGLMKKFKTEGYRTVRIAVIEENDKGLKFWNKLGFKLIKSSTSQINPKIKNNLFILEHDLLKSK